MDSPDSEIEHVCRRVVYHLTVKASIQVCLAAKLFPPALYQPRWIVAARWHHSHSSAHQRLRGRAGVRRKAGHEIHAFSDAPRERNPLTHELAHEVAFTVYIPAAVRRAAARGCGAG